MLRQDFEELSTKCFWPDWYSPAGSTAHIRDTKRQFIMRLLHILPPLSLHIKSWRIIYGGLDFMTDLKRSINTGHIWDRGYKMYKFYWENTTLLLCHWRRFGAFSTFERVTGIWSGSNRWLEKIDSKKPSGDERWCSNCFGRNSSAFWTSLVRGRNRQ